MALNFGPQSAPFEFARGPQQRPSPPNPMRPVTWILVVVGGMYLLVHGWMDSRGGARDRDTVPAAPGAVPPGDNPVPPPGETGPGPSAPPPAEGDSAPPAEPSGAGGGTTSSDEGPPGTAGGTAAPDGTAPPPPPTATPPVIEFQGALRNVKDFTRWEQDEAYHTLLHFIKGIPAKELLSRVQPGLGFNQMFHQPARCRGKIVQIRGTILDVYPFRLDPNPDGIKDVYEGHLVDAPSNTAYVFHILERPQKPLEREDEGRVAGVFLKVHQYVTQADQTQNVPFILGKRLEILGGQTFGPAAQHFHWIIGGAVAVVVLVLLAVMAFTRRSERLYDERLKEARKRAETHPHAPASGRPSPTPAAPMTPLEMPPFPGLPPAGRPPPGSGPA